MGVTMDMKKDSLVMLLTNINKKLRTVVKNTLGDDFIISKISDGKFSTLEQFKKAYYKEVKDKALNGLINI